MPTFRSLIYYSVAWEIFFSLRLQSLGFTGVHCQKWKVTMYLQKQMAHCTLGVCFGIQGKREKWSDAFTESSKRQLFWKNHWSRLLPLKGIRRAPAGAIQEPLAPLIAHWSERIIFVNATLPGVELYIAMDPPMGPRPKGATHRPTNGPTQGPTHRPIQGFTHRPNHGPTYRLNDRSDLMYALDSFKFSKWSICGIP